MRDAKSRELAGGAAKILMVLLAAGVVQAEELRLEGASRRLVPRIVNATSAPGFWAVGAILTNEDGNVESDCTATLIGCRTIVTAAHCFCGTDLSGADCIASGIAEQRLQSRYFYLLHGGIFSLAGIAVHPDYRFGRRADLAVLRLGEPVTRIAPEYINVLRRVEPGTVGAIVGFGTTGGAAVDSGLKRAGLITTSDCGATAPSDSHVCWEFLGSPGPVGEDSNTCGAGDSGAPLHVMLDGYVLVAGIHSGGTRETCFDDKSFNTDTFVYSDWIASAAGADYQRRCGGSPYVGDDRVIAGSAEGRIDAEGPYPVVQFTVPPGTKEVRVSASGEDFLQQSGPDIPNSFSLFVRRGAPPAGTEFDCSSATAGPYAYCAIADPMPGEWFALLENAQGAADFEINVTTLPAGSECGGDCNEDGNVTVDEIVAGVNVALGTSPFTDCLMMDADQSGTVTVDELLSAISNALAGCPAV